MIDLQGRQDLYAKQYKHRSLLDWIKHLVRPSRALRAMRAGAMLVRNEFYTPQVVAVAQKKLGPLVQESVLITRAVPEARNLHEVIRRWDLDMTASGRHRFCTALGHMVGRLHAAGISHGDLRPGNILIPQNSDELQFYLLDNERTVRFHKIPYKKRFKNLVQINMMAEPTATDRLRFLKAYLDHNPAVLPEWKSLAQKVHLRSRQRMRKYDQKN